MARIRHRFIRSRDDFFFVLSECLHRARDFERKAPKDPFLTNVLRQLEALDQWTAKDRRPTKDERRRLDFGLRVVRELDPAPTPELDQWGRRLAELFFYVKHWKSDEAWNALDDDDFKVFFPDDYAP